MPEDSLAKTDDSKSEVLPRISVVTPTFYRPDEVRGLLANLAEQKLHPFELILVDGAPEGEEATRLVAEQEFDKMPFPCRYIRHGGGTAIQRNVGIDAVEGNYIALIDDDIRLEPEFLKSVAAAFASDRTFRVGGIVGYRVNEYFDAESRGRWRWYRRLRLLKVLEPGRYDFETGYPINANLQAPFHGTREVDFMTAACAVWRRSVMDQGHRFDEFFSDYGVLEDAHFSLNAGKSWKLLQCGDARCRHDFSPNGRVNRRRLGYKCVVNYYFVFKEVTGPLSSSQKFRFWRYQIFEMFRIASSGVRHLRIADFEDLWGRLEGYLAVVRGAADRKSK